MTPWASLARKAYSPFRVFNSINSLMRPFTVNSISSAVGTDSLAPEPVGYDAHLILPVSMAISASSTGPPAQKRVSKVGGGQAAPFLLSIQ